MENQAPTPAKNGLNPNSAAALSYVLGFITGLYFYLTYKDKYVRFHAMQSIITSVALMAVSYVVNMLTFSLASFLSPLISLASLALVIFLIIKAYNGVKYKLPTIGDFAEKQA